MPRHSTLLELDRDECCRLLAGGNVGRVVFTERALPAIRLPHGRRGKLAAATRSAVVAFEIDEIDTSTRTGWSVVVVGHASEITEVDRLVILADPGCRRPWVPDRSAHTFAIKIARVTGRKLGLSDAGAAHEQPVHS